MLQNLAFFGFLTSLMVVYIYIVHQGESRVREYQSLRKEVKELRWSYLTTRSELMAQSRQSRIAQDLQELGLVHNGSVPVIIKLP